jgi:hypothetical protein
LAAEQEQQHQQEKSEIKTSDGSTKAPPPPPPYPQRIITLVTAPKVEQAVKKVYCSGNYRVPTVTFPLRWGFLMGLDLQEDRDYGTKKDATRATVVMKFDEATKTITIKKLDIPQI